MRETILGDLLEEFRERGDGAEFPGSGSVVLEAGGNRSPVTHSRIVLAGRSWSRPTRRGHRQVLLGYSRLREGIHIDPIRQDLRHAVRQLARKPGFTLVVVFTLALGIGANSAIFTIVNGVLLTPLPFDEPDRLVGVWHTVPADGFDRIVQSPALHYTYIDEGSFFEELGMWNNSSVSVTGTEEPEQVAVINVTEGTLRALRVQPHHRAPVHR